MKSKNTIHDGARSQTIHLVVGYLVRVPLKNDKIIHALNELETTGRNET